MLTPILFEHPLNEKMRTWLRIEFLIQQLYAAIPLEQSANTLHFLKNVGDLLDVFERGEIRTDLMKELTRQQRKLLSWSEVPGVDLQRIATLRTKLEQAATVLMAAPRLGQFLREDRLVALVRQRLSIPGGCCSFDLPTLHLWLNLPQSHRDEQVKGWLESLAPVKQALDLILDIIRQSSPFRKQTSLNGFYQNSTEEADLLRLELVQEASIYPQISGHKNRFAIRFMPLDPDHGVVPERIDFELACC